MVVTLVGLLPRVHQTTLFVMPDEQQKELRQIKWILTGILICLIIITGSLVPALLKLLLIFAIVFGLVMAAVSISQPTKARLTQKWRQLSTYWRR
jgi:hypothetical protein